MSGTSATTFSPDTPMTRAMLAAVLYRLEGSPAVTGSDSFTDTADGAWYADAVLWASQNGIVSGYGGGLFGTNDPITREQLAAILWRYSGTVSYTHLDVYKRQAHGPPHHCRQPPLGPGISPHSQWR